MDTIYWKPQLCDSNNVHLHFIRNVYLMYVCMVWGVDGCSLFIFIFRCRLQPGILILFIQQPTQQEEIQGPKT